jgi:hypothetical protein
MLNKSNAAGSHPGFGRFSLRCKCSQYDRVSLCFALHIASQIREAPMCVNLFGLPESDEEQTVLYGIISP